MASGYAKYSGLGGGGGSSAGVSSLNTLTGAVTLAAGTGISLTPSGNTITIANSGAGSGTVTSVSVVTANGLSGTVATATSTPAITLAVAATGVLKGNGSAISAATAGTDYSVGTSALATGILKSTTSTGALTIAVAADFPTLNQNTTGTAASVTGTNVVTNTNLAQMPANTIKGNNTGSTANALDLTVAQASALLGSSTSSASSLVLRDANGNAVSNNLSELSTTVVTAAGTTVLTVASSGIFNFTGTTTQTVTLPVATTLFNGFNYIFINNSTGVVTINDSTSTLVQAVSAGNRTTLYLVDASTAAGVWSTSTTGSSAFVNPMTTLGDIIYESATPAATRLAGNITAVKQFLSQTGNGTISAVPAWSALAGTDLPTSSTTLTSLGSLATVGTITTGTWSGTAIATTKGGTGQTSVIVAPAATTYAGWDANKNLTAVNHINSFQSTVTAAGTTTLAVGSVYEQYFTGTTTQTVILPVAATLVSGQSFLLVNNSTGLVTVNTSGGNTLQILGPGAHIIATCVNASGGTGIASWDVANISPTTWNSGLTWTFNNVGTTTNQNIYTKLVGDTMFVNGAVTLGTPAAAVASLSLPTGRTIKSTGIPSNASGTLLGFCQDLTPAAGTSLFSSSVTTCTFYDGTDTSKVYFAYQTNAGVYAKANASSLWNTGDVLSFKFDFAINT